MKHRNRPAGVFAENILFLGTPGEMEQSSEPVTKDSVSGETDACPFRKRRAEQ
jgi:hypothetical protein